MYCLEFGRKSRTYFLTSSERSGCFRSIGSYVLTIGIDGGWSSGSQFLKPPSQVVGMETLFPVPVAFLFLVRTVFPELRLFFGLPVRVT